MASKLSTYRAKRDFSKTREPSGARNTSASKRLRFVIQKHAARRLHYDLRLELDGVFKSWAVTRGPSLNPADKRLAVEVEDHPLDYGDFEGTIPPGQYGGGTVQLWDRGYWQAQGEQSPQEALRKGDLKFTLDGERLHGSWVLVRMRFDRNGGKRTNWLLIKHRDAFASAENAESLLTQDHSVASGRSMAQIAAGRGRGPKPFMRRGRSGQADAIWHGKEDSGSHGDAVGATHSAGTRRAQSGRRMAQAPGREVSQLPRFIEPQLAKLVERPGSGASWVHEIKFDGYRLQLRVQDGIATLRTRTGLDWTDKFQAIAAAARELPDCILDGEVVALNRDGVPSFSALQAALSEQRSVDLVFFVFDLLFLQHRDLRALPLLERKLRLEQLLTPLKSPRLRYVEHFLSSAQSVLDSACRMGLEGIVSKLADAPYSSDRRGSWTKTKCRAGQEVVIGGYTSQADTLRSLLVGVYRDEYLVYVGRVGTGFGQATARSLARQLRTHDSDDNPFEGDTAPRQEAGVHWVRPQLVAEIEFAGWTEGGNVRQAAFKGLRTDKPARQVRAEQVAPASTADAQRPLRGRAKGAAKTPAAARRVPAKCAAPAKRTAADAAPSAVWGVTISQPDKPLWPDAADGRAVTKLDLAHYLEAVGAWMLPHLRGRPCSLVRAPDGIEGQHFFQRHAMPGTSGLFEQVTVSGDRKPYLQIDRLEALAAIAQTAALELHPWNCEPFKPDVPGRLVFDLDPAPDVAFSEVVRAALELRSRLQDLGLVSFCKTTGGKGLHVVAPLKYDARSHLDWPLGKGFAQGLCMQMESDSPTRYLTNMAKNRRTGRIFLDYLRNDRMSTAVAPLSPRARAGAPVSMPLTWSQVRPSLEPARYTVRTTPALMKKTDPWSDYAAGARSLRPAIEKLTRQPSTARKPAARKSRRASASASALR